jgi:hypothetical protein
MNTRHVFLAACLALAAGCSSEPKTLPDKKAIEPPNKVNRTNYNQIEVGMTLERVQEILGPGKEAASGGDVQIRHWRSNAPGFNILFVSITFNDGKVKRKAIAGD